MKNAIIIGATSGIGRALAIEMAGSGYRVGATGRRTERLKELDDTPGETIFTTPMDVTDASEAIAQLHSLVQRMGGIDILVLNAGTASNTRTLDIHNEHRIIDVNVRGFVALAVEAYHLFERQGHGRLVGISSIASYFGYGLSPSYNASKAFISTYMQGLRQKASRSEADITIIDIKPGYVHTEMTGDKQGLFWAADAPTAARQMLKAIESRRHYAYITHRWRLVAWLLGLLPRRLFDHL